MQRIKSRPILNSIHNCKIYGNKPYKVAVLHGGPGAAGSMKECAKELSRNYGVLEPLQTAETVEGQIKELRQTLEQYAEFPVNLVGHSWGAMLGYLFAAQHPTYVKNLIMVSSGVFHSKYAKNITTTRLNRLNKEQKILLKDLMKKLEDNRNEVDDIFHKIGNLTEKADTFDSIELKDSQISKGQYCIYKSVWPQVEKMRETGKLLSMGKSIHCPVLVIHGDYDSHPYKGVIEPLSTVLNNVSFVLLDKCGHTPWIERYARDKFFDLIKNQLNV